MDCLISYALEKIARLGIILKPKQRKWIEHLYGTKDVFVRLTTLGFGKLFCYELLPFMFDDKLGRQDSLVIVVLPPISLMPVMVDQVIGLRRRCSMVHGRCSRSCSCRWTLLLQIMEYTLILCIHVSSLAHTPNGTSGLYILTSNTLKCRVFFAQLPSTCISLHHFTHAQI